MYRIVIKDLKPKQALLEALGKRLQDMRPAWRRISDSLSEFFRKQFETEGREGGQPWAARTTATQQILALQGRASTKILHSSGDLEASLTQPEGSPNALRVVNRKSLVWGSLVQNDRTGFPYAVAAQEGFTSVMKPVVNMQRGTWWFVPRSVPVRVEPRVLLPDPVPPNLRQEWRAILLDYTSLRA